MFNYTNINFIKGNENVKTKTNKKLSSTETERFILTLIPSQIQNLTTVVSSVIKSFFFIRKSDFLILG